MVKASIHKKYIKKQEVDKDAIRYMYPDVYLSYFKFQDNQIILDKSTIEKYKQLIKISCKEIKLIGGEEDGYHPDITTYYFNNEEVIKCKYVYLTNSFKYYISNKYIKWNNITVKTGCNAELFYAIQLDTGENIFILINIRIRYR